MNLALNSLLIVINIILLVHQFLPRIECYFFYVINDAEIVPYLAISNNSVSGLYISCIDYIIDGKSQELVGPNLSKYRLCGNIDYCIKLDKSCSVRIKFKCFRCLVNGALNNEVLLDEPIVKDGGFILRPKSSLSKSIIIDRHK